MSNNRNSRSPSIIDKNQVFKVFAGTAELSPFHNCYANDDTILRNCAGRLFAHYNGENVVSAYWALRKKAALFDVPERPIEVFGSDALVFLNTIFTRDISKLKTNRGQYVLACMSDGGMFMDAVLFRLSFDRYWIIQPDGDMITWLQAHKQHFNVVIQDPQSRVLQIQGPNSFKIMQKMSDGLIDDQFGYFHSGFFDIAGQKLFVSRTGWTGELGYEIYTQGAQTNCVQLWKDLMECGRAEGLEFSSIQAMNIRRIEAGILDSGSDFNNTINPFEAGLGKFVDLTKDNYIGREALQSATREKKIFGVLSKSIIPKNGYQVSSKGGALGVVTTGALSPHLDSGVGICRLSYPQNVFHGKMILSAPDGKEAECILVDLPFYDKNKQLPRTL